MLYSTVRKICWWCKISKTDTSTKISICKWARRCFIKGKCRWPMLTIVPLLRTWIRSHFCATSFRFVISNIMRAWCSIQTISIVASRSITTSMVNDLTWMSTSLDGLLTLRPGVLSRLRLIVCILSYNLVVLSSTCRILNNFTIIHISTC
jgi:hypothetical protein